MTEPVLKIVPKRTLAVDLDGERIALERLPGQGNFRLLDDRGERLPFVIHAKRQTRQIVDGWGFKKVTRWTWSVGYQDGAYVSYVYDAELLDDRAEAIRRATEAALAWVAAPDRKEHLAQHWRRQMGLREAERLRRGIRAMAGALAGGEE